MKLKLNDPEDYKNVRPIVGSAFSYRSIVVSLPTVLVLFKQQFREKVDQENLDASTKSYFSLTGFFPRFDRKLSLSVVSRGAELRVRELVI